MNSVRLLMFMQNGVEKIGEWYVDRDDRDDRDRGVALIEYGALVVLVGALVTALYAAGLLSKFSSAVSSAMSSIFTPSSGTADS